MAGISAQVSLYPLRQDDIGAAVDDAVGIFRERGVLVESGPMSTLLAGEDDDVLAAVRDAMRAAAARGEAVLIVTLSNACPVPQPEP